jgi:Tol biopolymer transport system component
MSRAVALAGAVWLMCGGCAAPERAPAIEPGPVRADARSERPETDAQAVAMRYDRSGDLPGADRFGRTPEDLSFFGDRPEMADLPFENRLLTNMRQHTFSTEGLDFDPAVSSDGKHVVFATTRSAERPDICMKRVDGTAITQLTGDPADEVQPRFSPDDSRVVFCSNRSGNWDIWMVEIETTRLTQLTRDPSDEISPCVSPDGHTVAFSVWGRRSGRWEIWTISLANPGVRRFLAYGMFPDFSPDGSKIAFQRARQRGSRWFSVWVSDLVEGEARHPREIAHSDAFACITPRWSPDGKSIVFCGVRNVLESGERDEMTGVRSDIWLVSEDGGYRTKLTDGAAAALNPTFGIDGRVYFVSTQSGSENIWSVEAESSILDSEKLATTGEKAAQER